MREILFRGKRIDNGEFIVGHLISYEDGRARITPSHSDIFCYEKDTSIIQTIAHEVVPETVGQFTGLTDKNGKKIFEGDIVKDTSGVVYPVVFDLTGFYLKYAPPHSHGFHYDILPLSNYWHANGAIVEVIGNIHDNPELLEVE